MRYRRGVKLLVSPNGLPVKCVDRTSRWGNPFEIGKEGTEHEPPDQPIKDRIFDRCENDPVWRPLAIHNSNDFGLPDTRSMERLEVSHDGSYILLVIFLCE